MHLVLIFFIFGISGSISLFLSDYVLELLNSGLLNLNLFYLLILRLLVLIILYQFILLIVSFFFGEFNYFSKYSLKLISLIKRVKQIFDFFYFLLTKYFFKQNTQELLKYHIYMAGVVGFEPTVHDTKNLWNLLTMISMITYFIIIKDNQFHQYH